MSVLRDAMGLGYGTDHFMITGENFPSEWQDDINEYTHDEMHEPEEFLGTPDTLDTKEGWIKRERYIKNENPVGIMSGEEYYRLDQTFSLSGLMESAIENIAKEFNKLQDHLRDSNLTSVHDLDAKYHHIREEIISEIDCAYGVIKEYAYPNDSYSNNKGFQKPEQDLLFNKQPNLGVLDEVKEEDNDDIPF